MDLTILAQSAKGNKKNFKKKFRLGSSNNRADNLSKTFWSVQTNVKRFTLLRYLKMKALMGLCSDLEYRVLLDWSGVLEDILFIDALRARNEGVPLETLFQRVAWVQKLDNMIPWGINLYFTLDNVVSYNIEEVRMTIRPVKKFSGYVRNSSSVGTKSKSTIYVPEPESFEWKEDVKKDFYTFFSVGEWNSGASGNFVLTLKMDHKSETGTKAKITKK